MRDARSCACPKLDNFDLELQTKSAHTHTPNLTLDMLRLRYTGPKPLK